MRTRDVAIIGAGPAGAALAATLAKAGADVIMLEASRYQQRRWGESLAPSTQPLLRNLGVWDDFLATNPLASQGTVSRWESDTVTSHSHLTSPYLTGWHIDRAGFDALLAANARKHGADTHADVRVTDIRHDSSCWQVRAGGDVHTTARFLVDATGRAGRVARMLGARRLTFDHLVAVGSALTPTRDAQHGDDGHVSVEAVEHGWWYVAPQPDGQLIALLMTDADICRQARLTRADRWQAALRAAPLTSSRCAAHQPPAAIRPIAAHSVLHLRTDHRPWLAVGDAALAVDPLTGSGVTRALRTAEHAADVIIETLNSPPDPKEEALARHSEARTVECDNYLHERLEHYAACRPIPAPFWQRRRTIAIQAGIHIA